MSGHKTVQNLDALADEVRNNFEEMDSVREMAYKASRDVTRVCANAIRAVHRADWETAEQLISEAATAVEKLTTTTQPHPPIYFAGYTQDCLKEYAEAQHTYALIRDLPLKSAADLNVEPAAWINGLAEAATELRRRILDIIRHDHDDEAERLLDTMNEIYSLLVTFDFRDAITGGLRRRTDTVRAVLERTRGDVTTSLRQTQLEHALASLEQKLREETE